jgi:16S rRNA (guanine966-N2)-methyltransferase
VREAVFDILYSLGGAEGRRVADLFCGTGALGIEAVARGAASSTFVDRDAAAIEAVRDNLTAVGLGDAERTGEATCVRADVDDWMGRTAARFDVAFCDPPYEYQGWDRLASGLPADLAVLESRDQLELPSPWEVLKSKRYGGTIVTVARVGRAAQKGLS